MSRSIRTARMRVKKTWGRVKDAFPYITIREVDEDEECQMPNSNIDITEDEDEKPLEHPPQEIIEISDDEKAISFNREDHCPNGPGLTWFIKDKVIEKKDYLWVGIWKSDPPANWFESLYEQRRWIFKVQNLADKFNSHGPEWRKGFKIIIPTLYSEYEDFNREFIIFKEWFNKQNP